MNPSQRRRDEVTLAAAPAEGVPHRALITICVMMATVMQTLDSTIANVALPYMQGSLAASQEEISWVLTSYIVATAIMTAPSGYLARRFGRTRFFVICTLGFTCSSILCGTAQSLDQIVVYRVLQGGFSASLVPLSQSTMLDVWPVEQRGTATAIWMMGALIGPILGPTLGGWLTENYNWRWVFYINVPFATLSTLGIIAFLKETTRVKDARLDWTGFLALSLGVGALQTMLDRGETLDWFASGEIRIEAVLSGLGFYIFLTQSALAPKPFLTPRLFRDLNFLSAIMIMFTLGLILFATMALLAPYLDQLLNYPVASAGLIMAPRGAGALLAAPICGRLVQKINRRFIVGFGLIATICSLYVMISWTPDVSEWSIASTGFVLGLSSSCLTVPVATIAFATLPAELRSEGAGVFSLFRNLGSSIGIAVTVALLEVNTQVNHAIIGAAVTPFNRVLQNGAPLHFWNPGTPQGAAALNAVITRQSSIIAYANDFKLLLFFAIAALPLVLLIRNPSPMLAGGAAAE
jgi:DHA2 family multidrug resistance protein